MLADGALLGEGAVLFALELPRERRSGQRGADIFSTILGSGAEFSPPEREATLVYGSADAVERAIQEALAEACVGSAEVDVVVSGIAGHDGDSGESELAGIHAALGASAADACVLAPKLGLGESLGAGGAMGMLAAATVLSDGAHSHVLRGRLLRRTACTALVTAMGYYGNASALVMRQHPTRVKRAG